MKRKVSGIMLTLLLVGMLTLAFNIQPVKTEPTTIIVPDDYSTIQEAISNASSGDTIYVRAGTYYGHITLDKPLTLRGESNQNTTLAVRGGIEYSLLGIRIITSNVAITGFKITYDDPPVLLIIIDGRNAICVNNTIKDNILVNTGTDALVILNSRGNKILDNLIIAEDGFGVYIDGSDFNIFDNNTVIGGDGVVFGFSSNNTISNNLVTNQTDILSMIEVGAISFGHSSNNTVTGNTLLTNNYGISIWGSRSKSNSIYHNNFVNNTHQVFIELSYNNTWDNGYPFGGNYWSDYTGIDLYSGPNQDEPDSDGIGDTSYSIPIVDKQGNTIDFNYDNYPLTKPWKPILGDLNLDGKVDGKDLIKAAKAFASYGPDFMYPSSQPHQRWDPDADVNGDGVIDGRDLLVIARNFGKTYR